MYFCYLVITSPWKRAGSHIWLNFNPLYPGMYWAKFGWGWNKSYGEEDFPHSIVIPDIFFYLNRKWIEKSYSNIEAGEHEASKKGWVWGVLRKKSRLMVSHKNILLIYYIKWSRDGSIHKKKCTYLMPIILYSR